MENRLLVSTPEIKTPRLQEAIKANDFAKLQGLLREGYSLEDQDAQGNLPIHIAASSGNIEIIQYLLGLKSPLEKVNREKQNPLHIAAAHGHVEAVALLLRKGIPVEAVDINQRTALHLAVANQRLAVVEQLVAAHTNVLMQDQMGSTPLHLAATYGLIDIMRLLADKVSGQFKALLNMQDQDGKTPTHCAAFTSNTVCMKFLLKHGANINAITDYGYTPLFFAIRDNNLKMVKLLLKRGAFLFIDNINNQTPIQYARELVKAPELTKVLLKARRQAIKQVPQTLTASLSRLLLQGDKALDKQQLGEAREHYYQALSQSHIAGNIHLTLWSWQKVLKLALVQQQFDLAAKALMAMEQALCQAQQQSFPSVRVLQQGRWLANYQFSILEHCVKAFRQGKFLNMALVHLDKFKGEISTDNLTKQRRQQLVSLRSAVKQSLLQNETPIPNLLAQITDKFKALVREIVNYSMQVLGEAPCEYALVGLGSMSRNEMSTHSDLECAILIGENTEDNKAYFRQLTRLMELQLIFLGETRVRGEHLQIESPIAAGFGLDSEAGLSPLGIKDLFELIGTPYHLAQFHEDAYFRGAERLQSNALKNVDLIVGNEKLVTLYYAYTNRILAQKNNQQQTFRQQQALTMMKDELRWHAPDLSEKKREERAFNVKNELYRLPNTILNNLAVYYNLTAKNAWDRIKELQKKGKLTASAGQHWQQAMTDIARLRLLTHLYYGCEQEHIHHQTFAKPTALTESTESLLPMPKQSQLIFSEEQIQKLFAIYQVLLPLYQAMKVFVDTKGKDKRFKKEKLVEDVLTAQGETLVRAFRYKEAIEVYQKALAADPNNLDIRLKLAQAYSLLGDPIKQKDLLHETWQLYQHIKQAKVVQGVQILTSLSVAYGQLGDASNQCEYASQALALCREHFGENHIETAKCRITMADAYGEMGEQDKQISTLQEALTIYEGQVQEGTEVNKATVLINLGTVYASQEHYAQAKRYLEQGLIVIKAVYGVNHPKVATVLVNLANVHGAQSNIAYEIQLLQEALAIQEAVYGNQHPHVAITLSNLGNAYGILKNMPQCIATLQYALSIQERCLLPTHPQIAITLVNLSNAYVEIGDSEKLEIILQRIDNFITQMSKKKVPPKELPKMLVSLSDIYSRLEQWDKAAALLEHAFSLQNTFSTPSQQIPFKIKLNHKLYEIYVQQPDVNKQKVVLKRLLTLYRSWHGKDHLNVAKVYFVLGIWYELQQKYHQQVKVLKQALAIYEHLGTKNKYHLQPALDGLQNAYAALNKPEKIAAITKRKETIKTVPGIPKAESALKFVKLSANDVRTFIPSFKNLIEHYTNVISPSELEGGIRNVGLRNPAPFMQPKINESLSELIYITKERRESNIKPISEFKEKIELDKKNKIEAKLVQKNSELQEEKVSYLNNKKVFMLDNLAKYRPRMLDAEIEKVLEATDQPNITNSIIKERYKAKLQLMMGYSVAQVNSTFRLMLGTIQFENLLTYAEKAFSLGIKKAIAGYEIIKERLMQTGKIINLNAQDNDGYTALHWTAKHQDEECTALLIGHGCELNITDSNGWTALHIVAFHGNLTIARLLLLNGADISIKTTNNYTENEISYPVGCTPLEVAKYIEHTYMVQLFEAYKQNQYKPKDELITILEAITDISSEPQFQCMDLVSAVQCGDLIAAQRYLRGGADPNSKIKTTPLLVYAAKHMDESMCQMLIKKGALINATDVNGYTGLHYAASSGIFDLYRLFVSHKANIHAVSSDESRTAVIHSAIKSSNLKILEELLDMNIDPNLYDGTNNPLIHQQMTWKVGEMLIKKGANPYLLNANGNSLFHRLALDNNYSFLQHLLRLNDTLNLSGQYNKNPLTILNIRGQTPLQVAAEKAAEESIKVLLGYQARCAVDKNPVRQHVVAYSMNPSQDLLVAVRKNDLAGVEIALSHGANPNVVDKEFKRSALHWAIIQGNGTLVDKLLAHDISIDIADDYGWPAIYYAIYFKRGAIVQTLLNANAEVLILSNKAIGMEGESVYLPNINGLQIAEMVGNQGLYQLIQTHAYKQIMAKENNAFKEHVIIIAAARSKKADILEKSLIAAVRSNNIELVEKCLAAGASPDSYDSDWPLLLYAVAYGNVAMVKVLQAYKVNLYAEAKNDEFISNALDVACRYAPKLEMVQYLVKLGFDVNRICYSKTTALMNACWYASIDIVKFLCQQGAELNVTDQHGRTPLLIAAESNYISPQQSTEIIRYLVEETDCDIKAKDYRNNSAIINTALNGNLAAFELLMSKGLAIDEANIYGWTPLMAACSKNFYYLAERLIKAGADISARNNDDRSVLGIAVENQAVECVKLLLDAGADCNHLFLEKQSSPLINASAQGHAKIVQLLLGRDDVNIDIRNDAKNKTLDNDKIYNRTPLIAAAIGGHAEVIKLLLAKNPIINTYDSKGWTALKAAANFGYTEVVRLLLAHPSTDPNFCGKNETRNTASPLNVACENGFTEMAELLLKHPDIDINQNDFFYGCPLTQAVENNCLEIVKLLLQRPEINLSSINSDGDTPLSLARRKGFKEIETLLVSAINISRQKNEYSLLFATQVNNLEMVNQLLAVGEVDVNESNAIGESALYIAAKEGYDAIVERLLQERNIDSNKATDMHFFPLYVAATYGNLNTVKQLLAHPQLDVNQQGPMGQTALMQAASLGRATIVALMLDHPNIDPNLGRAHIGNDGFNPLLVATRKVDFKGLSAKYDFYQGNNNNVVRLLIQQPKIDVNYRTAYSDGHFTPLINSVNFCEQVRQLLAQPNIKLNLASKDNYSALSRAAANGYTETLYMLLAKPGMAINLPSKEGYTPLYCAAEANHMDCIEALLQAKDVDVNKSSILGKTPLYIAAENGYLDSVKLLIKAVGIDLNKATKEGETPLMVAAQKGYAEIAKALTEAGAELFLTNKQGMTARLLAYAETQPKIGGLLKEMEDKCLLAKAETERVRLQTELAKAKEIEKQLAHKASVSNLDLAKAEKYKTQLETIQKEQQTITRVQQIKQWQVEVHSYILERQSLKLFYYYVQEKLAECFYAYKSLTQLSIFELNNIQSNINLLNRKINLPAVKLIASYLVGRKEQIQEKEQLRLNFILPLISDAMQLNRTIEVTARLLTFEYEQQIKVLKDQEQIHLFVESILARLLELIEAGELTVPASLYQQTQYALIAFKAQQSILKLTDRRLKLVKDAKEPWTDRGIFQQSGVMLVDGRCFAEKDAKADVYGYRLIDESKLAKDVMVKPSQAPNLLSKDNPLLVKEVHVDEMVTQAHDKNQGSLLQRLGFFAGSVQNTEVAKPGIDPMARKKLFII